MPRIEVQALISAPPDLVFDLARSIDLHVETQTRHRERAVAGRTTGLIQLGESVTREGVPTSQAATGTARAKRDANKQRDVARKHEPRRQAACPWHPLASFRPLTDSDGVAF